MNNQSPFLPPNSPTEQKNQARARVKIAVFFVLAVNGIGLMALLMQGCRQEKPAAEAEVATNQAPPEAVATTDTNAPGVTATNTAAPVAETAAPPTLPTPPTPPTQTESEYTIVSGDKLSAIAKKNHVTLSALEAANPGIEPTKLKIGQKIHIPAPTATMVASAGGTAADSANGEQVYTVKSGDTLSKIAGQTGASVKSIRSQNNLKTDKIVVGQKLKIPAKGTATPALTPATPSSNTDSASIMPVSTSAPPLSAPLH